MEFLLPPPTEGFTQKLDRNPLGFFFDLAAHPTRSWLRSVGFDISRVCSAEMDLQAPSLLSSGLISSCCAPWDPRITGDGWEVMPSLGLHMLWVVFIVIPADFGKKNKLL